MTTLIQLTVADDCSPHPITINVAQICTIADYEGETYVRTIGRSHGVPVVESKEAIENRLRNCSDVTIVSV